MKIALFHNLGGGGGKRYVHEHARLLRRRGHNLDLFIPATASEEYLPLAPFCDNVSVYGEKEAASPVSTEGRGARRLVKRFLGETTHDLIRDRVWVGRREQEAARLSALYARMARDIDRGGYDALYVHQCDVMLAPDLLRQMTRTPTLFCCHDSLRRAYEWALDGPPAYDTLPETGARRKRLGRFLSPILLAHRDREERRYVENTRAAGGVIVNSWYSREAILRSTGVSGRVCYAGVDSAFFCPDETVAKEPVVLSVGALVPHKRHEFVLEAVAALPAESRPRLEIIGYETRFGSRPGLGPFALSLQERAGRLRVDLRIEKDITDESLRDAYRRARVFAFAPYLEPFGLVPLEAAACATPTVGVSEAGIRETVRDEETGLLTDLDTEAFAHALDRVLHDALLARTLGQEGRRRAVEEWTWERSGDVLESALRRVAERQAS